MVCAQAWLLAGDGIAPRRLATPLGSSRPTVLSWRARLLAEGLDAVGAGRPGRGRQPRITAQQVQALGQAPLPETPPGATPWSCRSRTQAAGVSRSTVQRIRDAHGLQPHRSATCKLAQDPACVEQLTAGVGRDRNPPDQAVVLGGDEQGPRQALDRPPPGLPRQPGRCGTLTHASQRPGPPTWCAAWHVLTGEVLGQCHGRPRPQACLPCLRRLDRAFPRDRTLPVILDNSAPPKHQKVHQGLAARPRRQLPCPPTGASGLHLVESWCSPLPQQRLRRGVCGSGPELGAALQDSWTHHNADPQPCVGSTTVEAILAKVSKCKVILGTHCWASVQGHRPAGPRARNLAMVSRDWRTSASSG